MTNQKPKKTLNEEIYEKTMKYQKKFNFEISDDPNHRLWNNEGDAFKHSFLEAVLSERHNSAISRIIGDAHELDGRLFRAQPTGEENMDKWNNQIGRDIAKEVQNEIKGREKAFTPQQIEDMFAIKIMERMRQGDLITTPSDKRSYEKKLKGSPTGYAAPSAYANFLNPISNDNRIFTREDLSLENMNIDDYSANEKAINAQLKTIGIPTNGDMEREAINSGDVVYVNPYTREDGTRVKGYYRAR